MRILVADDSAMMRRLLVESLKKWQYDVVETDEGPRRGSCFSEIDSRWS